MAAFTTPQYSVTEERDVVYGIADGFWTEGPDHWSPDARKLRILMGPRRSLELKMDIYTPEDDNSACRPLLLMMHGGSFLFGNKEEAGQAGWCRHFASLGYTAASIDYRLGYPATGRGFRQAETDALEDARAALAFLSGYGNAKVDPERIFVAGTSAGGALAMGLGYDPSPACRIRAVGNLWGYVRDLSVLGHAQVPMLSFQSLHDPVVPYYTGYPLKLMIAGRVYGTGAIHDEASRLGIRSEHVPCPEKAHRLHLDGNGVLTPRFYDIRDALSAFFAAAMQDSI